MSTMEMSTMHIDNVRHAYVPHWRRRLESLWWGKRTGVMLCPNGHAPHVRGIVTSWMRPHCRECGGPIAFFRFPSPTV